MAPAILSAQLPRKVVLAAGGTGGHMFPAEALARELIARGVDIALVTDAHGGAFRGDLASVETFRIAAGAMAGAGLSRQLRSVVALGIGYLQARRHLRTGEGGVDEGGARAPR